MVPPVSVGFGDSAAVIASTDVIFPAPFDGGSPIGGEFFANRKWIGTNNGIWLISADGNSILLRFTQENSPLPSNLIQKITIDPITGDVYIGTEGGLVSYRGYATEGNQEDCEVKIFPNPVQSGYSGIIAISGLVENSDVSITDISGQLVYRTKSLGGQAVWNGLDYTGHRPQSGVYLILEALDRYYQAPR